jgi:hypothetical protein
MDFFRGHLIYYRIYDIGSEIDLKVAFELLNRKNLTEQFRLKKSVRALIIDDAPIVITLDSTPYDVLGKRFQLIATAKLWNFGSLSITFKIHFPENVEINEFKKLSHVIENDVALDRMAKDCAYQVIRDLEGAIKMAGLWTQNEDYMIYVLDPQAAPKAEDIQHLMQSEDLFELILTETSIDLSPSVIESMKRQIFQYSDKDVAIVDWNSAFICGKDDAQDICDVIEFGLCQSLEMRYYDDKLDKKLSALYKAVQNSQTASVFSSDFKVLAKDAAIFYMEINDIKEKINNSLKVIGDIHYAKIYRMALEKLRMSDWNQSVEEKLMNLREIATMFQNDMYERRNQVLELTIIVLIAVEVVPLIVNLVKHLF